MSPFMGKWMLRYRNSFYHGPRIGALVLEHVRDGESFAYKQRNERTWRTGVRIGDGWGLKA